MKLDITPIWLQIGRMNSPDYNTLFIAGQVELSGLLLIQMPADMETVEAQFEDVPRDMKCHAGSEGNTYDFAFGLNWSGVIKDGRTAKYDVPPIKGGAPE